jgi:hypothetical protein
LTYGGSQKDFEARFIATNYPAELVDVIEIPYRIDPQGDHPGCGFLLFLGAVDHRHVETLALAGGHDELWTGQLEGVFRIPKNLAAERLVLFSEPYCSDHVPQYGDRYGVAWGPFRAGERIELRLDQLWSLDQAPE